MEFDSPDPLTNKTKERNKMSTETITHRHISSYMVAISPACASMRFFDMYPRGTL